MKKISYYLLFIVVAGGVLVSFWVYQRYIKVAPPNFLSFAVERKNIQETVKVRGEIVPQKDFDLEFPFPGTVKDISVKEGQQVKRNDLLMKLETTDFELEAKRLDAVLAQNQAALDKLNAGLTKEDLRISETKVISAKTLLDDATINTYNVTIKANADLKKDYSDALTGLGKSINIATNSLFVLTDIQFAHYSAYDQPSTTIADAKAAAVFALLGGTSAGRATNDVIGRFSGGAKGLLTEAQQEQTQASIDAALAAGKSALGKVRTALEVIPVTSLLTSTESTNLSTERNNMNIELAAITNKQDAIASRKAQNQSDISVAEAGVNSAQNALASAQDEFALKKASARAEDIEIAEAHIDETKGQIAIIREKIKKSALYAPGDATVTKVLFEEGELSRPGETAITLTTVGHKIQSDISEFEIGKVRENDGNEALVRLDSFPGLVLKGRVVSIDVKEIIKEGDKYYRANIYVEPHGADIRSGMNADLTIFISSKENVLTIPELTIYKKEGKQFVTVLEEGRQKEVKIETGISDGRSIEVTKGLNEGQTVTVVAD